MSVQNQPLENRSPRFWTLSVTCAGLLLVAAVAALSISPQAAAGGGSAAAEGEAKPARADQTPPRARKAFTETLPCGIAVELLSVSEEPSNTKWRPDGSSLTEPPHDSSCHSIVGEKHEIEREITVRLSNLPSEPVSTAWRLDLRANHASGWGRKRPDIRTISLQVPATTKSVNLWFGIAEGHWNTRLASDQKDDTLREKMSGIDRGVIFSDPIEKAGKGVVVQVAYATAVDGERRIIAVDGEGREHTATSTIHDFTADVAQLTAVFSHLLLNGIKQFRFQSRAYQWIEFRNVSLWPGEQTDVQILQSTTPPRESDLSEEQSRS